MISLLGPMVVDDGLFYAESTVLTVTRVFVVVKALSTATILPSAGANTTNSKAEIDRR
jgi:uncharacterized membrane protein